MLFFSIHLFWILEFKKWYPSFLQLQQTDYNTVDGHFPSSPCFRGWHPICENTMSTILKDIIFCICFHAIKTNLIWAFLSAAKTSICNLKKKSPNCDPRFEINISVIQYKWYSYYSDSNYPSIDVNLFIHVNLAIFKVQPRHWRNFLFFLNRKNHSKNKQTNATTVTLYLILIIFTSL